MWRDGIGNSPALALLATLPDGMGQPMEWDTALQAFRDYLAVERAYSPRTVAAYLGDLGEFHRLTVARRGAPLRLTRIDSVDIRSHLAALHGKNDAASIARKLSSLRAFFRFLLRRCEVEHNPARAIRSPKRKKSLPRALDVDDTFRLMEAPQTAAHKRGRASRGVDDGAAARAGHLRSRDRAILEVLYGAGVRVSECCGLDLDDVDASRHATVLLTIRRGKGGKGRVVPLGRKAAAALDDYRVVRDGLADPRTGALDPHALFVNHRGGRLTARSVQRALRFYTLASGTAPATPHALRHSFATHLLDGGVDLRAIQELLGHASLASTQVYTRVSLDHLMAVYDAAHPRARTTTSPRPGAPAQAELPSRGAPRRTR